MGLVYKLVRSDDKIYIGTTISKTLSKRLSQHRNSDRFKKYTIKDYSILYETENLNDLYQHEEYFIKIYNSYYDGLNKTINGRGNHLSPKFTTLNFKFSENSKQKMKKAKVNWNPYWTRGKKFKKKNSYIGKRFSSKLNEKDVNIIKEKFKTFSFSKDIVIKYIKKTQINSFMNDEIDISKLIFKNGKPISFARIFAHEICNEYNVSVVCIFNILNNNNWSNEIVWQKGEKNAFKIK